MGKLGVLVKIGNGVQNLTKLQCLNGSWLSCYVQFGAVEKCVTLQPASIPSALEKT